MTVYKYCEYFEFEQNHCQQLEAVDGYYDFHHLVLVVLGCGRGTKGRE